MAGLSRRSFLSFAFGTFITVTYCPLSISRTDPPGQVSSAAAPGKTPEQWMSEWMSVYKDVSGALRLGRFKDPMYFLLEPISWIAAPTISGLPHEVTAPKGFVSDLASIPRVFWSLLRPDGDYAYAAIIHDYLYWEQQLDRKQSDQILKSAMQDLHVDTPTVSAIYDAVRVGGGSAWSNNAKERQTGEKRVLKRFPEDPRITWTEWKKQPDVFQ